MDDDTFGGDTALPASDEDQSLDTLDDAVDALADDEDDTLSEEHPAEAEGEAASEDDLSDEAAETDADADFEEGDEVLVVLGDGEHVQLGELKKGYFRQKDYTHKTEALSQERTEVEGLRSEVQEGRQLLQTAYQNLTDYLTGLVPPEPDLALAQSDPGAYQYQQALRANAISELQQVMGGRQDVDLGADLAFEQDMSRYKAAEDRKLVEAMPTLKDPGRKAAFDAANRKTALEFGFSDEEITTTADHRILQLVHFARIGKLAEANRRNAGRRVSEKATKGKARTMPAAGKPAKSREAMKRLSKTGSFEDAMKVDFD